MEDNNFEVQTEITNCDTPSDDAKAQTSLDFNLKLHRLGRIWTLVGVLLILAVPIIMCIYYKTMPNWAIFADAGVISLLLINLGSSLSEPFIYAPMLGTNGEYLAFITGNLSNLKIPCVVKAQEIAETKLGTEENELVSTISIAVSTLVTVIIVAIMVMFLAISPLQETIAENPFLTKAFGAVVYALFGSLGGKYLVKNPKLALFPALVLIAITVIMASVGGGQLGSISLVVGIALCLVFAILQFKRDKKKLDREQEMRRLQAIASGISYDRLVAIEKTQKEDEAEAAKSAAEAKKAAKKAK